MKYKKLSENISDPISDNVKALGEIFPLAVKDGEVDFEALKEELGKFKKTGKEKYELTWAGKKKAKKRAQEEILGRTLKYVSEESKDADTTQNLYIEGNNLEVLKLLRENYYGSIKMIYIDPPYNTGSDKIYNDDFKITQEESDIEEGNMDKEGNRFVKNQKSSNRYHARWLSMMYPRLKLAKDLLTQDGVIFISIDDNEVTDLRQICDEIFGEENFLGEIIIQANKGGQDYKDLAKTHEYLICYGKSDLSSLYEIEKEGAKLKYCDDNGGFDIRELRNRNPKFGRFNRPNLFFPIYVKKDIADKDGLYSVSLYKNESYTIEVYPLNSKGEESCWRWGKEKFNNNNNSLINKSNVVAKPKNNGGWNIYEKYRKTTQKIKTIWDETSVRTENGTIQLRKLFSRGIFDHPKPVDIIEKCLKISSIHDDIVLDFFSGSATTAHAVMQLNAEDGGSRKFIMVQLPEPCEEKSEAYKAGYKNICEIGKERIRRAGDKIKRDLQEKKSKQSGQQSMLQNEESVNPESLDIGFKVFKTGDTNIRWTHEALQSGQISIDENAMSDKDRLDFMSGFKDIDVVYEVLLRQRDVPLSSKVERLSSIGERTYMFAESFVVCLEEKIDREMIEKLAAVEPLPIKFIFRDSAFEDDIELKDETFRRLGALIERNTGESGKAYSVEFI